MVRDWRRRLVRWAAHWARGLDAEFLAVVLTLDLGALLWLLWLVGRRVGWW